MRDLPCKKCGRRLRIADELLGRKLRCPQCGEAVVFSAGISSLPTLAGVASQGLSQENRGSEAVSGGDALCPEQWRELLSPPRAPGELGRLGGYRILRLLGSGGMGVVFEAEDVQLQRRAAVKAVLPTYASKATARHRFLREARAAAALKHDNVVSIYQVGEEGGVPFIAMEFLEGESLDARLKRAERLSVPQAARVGRQVAEALDAAHKVGLVHRDIKPANIWLESPRERVKILDFGLARSTREEKNLTQVGSIVGTPGYMAPEQAQGQKAGPAADLFSLGCVLYRCLTGEAPFAGTDAVSTLVNVISKTPIPPKALNSAVQPGLNDLVLRLLEKDPASRPAGAAEVATLLSSFEGTSPSSSGDGNGTPKDPRTREGGVGNTVAVSPAHSSEQKPRIKPIAWIVGGAAAVLLGVLAFLTLGGRGKAEIEPAPAAKGTNGEQTSAPKTPGQKSAGVKTGTLVLRIEPKDATVTLTRKDGKRYSEKADAPFLIVDEGTYVLSIEKKGFQAISKQMKIAASATELVEGKLEVVDSAIALWFKERFAKDGVKGYLNFDKDGRIKAISLPVEDRSACDAYLDKLRGLQNLEMLCTPCPRITDSGLKSLKEVNTLRLCDLSHSQVSDAGLEYLLSNTALIELVLRRTKISDKALETVAQFRELRRLHLDSTKITNKGLFHLQSLKNLQQLTIGNTDVTDEGISYLSGLRQLRTVWVENTRVTREGVLRVKKALPSCNFYGEKGNAIE